MKGAQKQRCKGFTLIEAIFSIGIFILFAVGIYSGIQYTFKSVYFSRVRILETAILNEQLEIIRNIPFHDVGIINGSPSGVLERTVTTTRNSIDFLITRTIRNIDDPFDGTVDGTIPPGKAAVCHDGNTLIVGLPAVDAHLNHGDTLGECEGGGGEPDTDLAPADYKLVEVSIICTRCGQSNPLVMSTFVAPKYLEGNPNNGALKIEVYENNYQDVVQGATVHIIATSTSTTIDIIDTTNNNGQLLLVDLPEGQSAYSIVVTKDGYTTDMTRTSIPNPLKPPASVIPQSLQTISFEINPESTINLTTVTSLCVPIGSVTVLAQGQRLIGTDPDTLETNVSFNTSASGEYQMTGLSPDDYSFQTTGYDVIGAIPIFPLTVTPGTEYTLDLVLGPESPHSLVVHVRDSVSGQPIPNALVEVSGPQSYSESEITGIGHSRQTDWSGGDAQDSIGDSIRYFQDDGNIDINSSPGNITLVTVGANYVSSGWLESSTFDLGTSVTFQTFDWQPFVQASETGESAVRFQLASSATSTPESWDFIGPDGTGTSYYDEFNTNIHESHTGDRYFRYKVFLSTDDISETPVVSDLSVSYTTSCTPPGQAYFGTVSNKKYDIRITADGYEQYQANNVDIDGDVFFIADLISE